MLNHDDIHRLNAMSAALQNLVAEIEKDMLIEKAQLTLVLQQLEIVDYFICSVPVENARTKQLALEQLRSVIAALKQRT
jgi:hypothetical protein